MKEDSDEEDLIAPGEFIFIIDRSGSMGWGNNRIETAKEALRLFIQSIPPGSKFNVISFGSDHKCLFNKSQEYNKKSLENALKKISNFKADFGGTNLYGPIKEAIEGPVGVLARSVFVLTDGEIGDRASVVQLVRNRCHNARIHMFGIGDGADQKLVEEVAKGGKGRAFMIPDNDPTLQAKIISALQTASIPAFTSVKVEWGFPVIFQTPDPDHMEVIYQGDSLSIQAIARTADIPSNPKQVKISLYNAYSEKTVSFFVDASAPVESPSSLQFAVAAKQMILRKQNLRDHKKEEIVAASKKYQVLCSETAMFGKIRNKDKPDEEMKTIEAPVQQEEEPIEPEFALISSMNVASSAAPQRRMMRAGAAAPMAKLA